MAESGLTLQLSDYQHAASEYLYGGDGTYSANTASEQDRIGRMINEGLLQFYNPTSLDGAPVHEWSFLNPVYDLTLNSAYSTGTVTVAAGVATLASGTFPSWAASGLFMVNGVDYTVATRDSNTQLTLSDTTVTAAAGTSYNLHEDDYTLPDNFSVFIGEPTFRPSDNAWVAVKLVDESRIRELRQNRLYNGFGVNQPWMCAIQPVVLDPTTGTRNKILFWPRVQNSGVVSFAYRVRPDVLTATNKYPYGASDHSQTILASILAICELKQENARGVFWDDFQRKLKASIDLDARANRAQYLGYMGDQSDDSAVGLGRHLIPNQVTYRGMVVP